MSRLEKLKYERELRVKQVSSFLYLEVLLVKEA